MIFCYFYGIIVIKIKHGGIMKKYIRMVLDIVLLILILTLFDKRFIGMKYHEVAGIATCILILLHIGLNIKTFCALPKNFAKLSLSWKLNFIFDISLMLCFLYLLVSGILCSHILFPNILKDSTFFKFSHIVIGGISVFLLGFHIGLHLCKKRFPFVPFLIVTILVVIGASWGMKTSSEVRWLLLPFSLYTNSKIESTSTSDTLTLTPNTAEHNENESQDGQKRGKGQGKGLKRGIGGGKGTGPADILPLSIKEKAKVLLQFLCMIAFPIVLCYWLCFIAKKLKTKANAQ